MRSFFERNAKTTRREIAARDVRLVSMVMPLLELVVTADHAHVHSPYHLTSQNPIQVRNDKTRLEIEKGRTARFVCTVTGSSREMTYILSWSKQGGQMLSRAIDQNGVLVIPNIQRSDAGNYVCMGSDINHMEEAIATLIVTAPSQTAPEVRIEPRYQEVQAGTPICFTCIATVNPTPRVEWYCGGNREMNPAATITSDECSGSQVSCRMTSLITSVRQQTTWVAVK